MTNMKKLLVILLAVLTVIIGMVIVSKNSTGLPNEDPEDEDFFTSAVVVIDPTPEVPLVGPEEIELVNVTLVRPNSTKTIQLEKGSLMEPPNNNPEESGFKILYWYVKGDSAEAQFFFYTPITSDITLIAKHEAYVVKEEKKEETAETKAEETKEEAVQTKAEETKEEAIETKAEETKEEAVETKTEELKAEVTGNEGDEATEVTGNEGDEEKEEVIGNEGDEEKEEVIGNEGDEATEEVTGNEGDEEKEEEKVLTVDLDISFEGDQIFYGDVVTFTAVIDEEVLFQWQVSKDGGATWTDIAGETGKQMRVTITEENVNDLWRVTIFY